MYAIVDIAGQQFKVEKDQKIFVHRLESEVGSQVDFDKVLLIDTDSSVVVGTPIIEGAMITAKILEHLKGDKVIVFKKKRRKGYKVKNGHRQFFTKIEIEEIIEKGAKKKEVVKPAPKAVKKVPAIAEETPVAEAKPVESIMSEPIAETAKPITGEAKKATVKKPTETKKEAAPEKTSVAKKAGESKKAPVKKTAETNKAAAPKKTAETKKTEGKAAPKKVKKADDTK